MMKNKKKDNRKRLFDLPLLARIFAFAKPYAGKFLFVHCACLVVGACIAPTAFDDQPHS